ncbi:glycosyltransferase family 61 protein [Heliorestis acidaminivorans]|uniref:Glycosyltransferase family 61 protein n=1 Tax=Heliorestis acidaminivorans TaxID=553427 RepID=A0A6I0EWM7_9FIRM|nr:glycosyltransferase family 61 protein [Heliorestis acidaminivorans]KAB2951557.1 glycosyltransferase family 61 protein [Heliorestis acidaminivorans]
MMSRKTGASYYHRTWDYLEDNSRESVKDLTEYQIIYPSKQERTKEVYSWEKESAVAQIPQALIWGKHGAVIAPNGKLIWDLSYEWFNKPEEHPFFYRDSNQKPQYVDAALAMLTHPISHNYFHWLFEVLPRLDLIRQSRCQVDQYVVTKVQQPYQQESLSLLAIDQKDMVYTEPELYWQVRKVIAPTFLTGPSHWACQYLRHAFLPLLDLKSSRKNRIFIRRNNYRKIINEEEVYGLLKKKGFQAVLLEKLSFLDQVRLFAEAEAVVGTHGAGLSNLVFCSKGCKVVELFPASYVWKHFEYISVCLDLDYKGLIGPAQECDRQYKSWGLNNFDHLTVPVKELEAMLVELKL